MIVNNQPPVVTIATPLNGHSYLQNDYVQISATASSSNAIATTTYTLNGTPVDPSAQLPLMSQPLGTANLVVSATDIYGNVGYATSTFTVLPPDLTPPTINISSPVAGATYFDTATVLAAATITDASPIAATTYTFNGATIDPSKPLPLLGAVLGPATLSVAASDIYGNAASSSVTFTIRSSDVTPPTIIITNPVAGYTYAATSSVLVAATITDSSGIATTSYTLGGMVIDPTQPLPFVQVGAGSTTLVVTATDNFGNVGSSSVSFVISSPPVIQPDTQAPVIVITNPVAGEKFTRSDTVFVTASVTDSSPIANVLYFFNGKQIDQSKPLPLKNAPLGTAILLVTAKDSAGNTGSTTIKIRIMPGADTCIEDITDAFDHKLITGSKDFKAMFSDCKKIADREGDRGNYGNDDNKKNKNPQSDDRYLQAEKDVSDAFNDIDQHIQN